jgi:hypothetical protein
MKIDYTKFNNEELNIAMGLVRRIKSYGYEAYAVGGCVRDMVRYYIKQTDSANIHDIDIATNMPIPELQGKFHTESNNGEKHGTILVLIDKHAFEVTQFRTDGDYTDGRHPDSVKFAKTFNEDAARRDFTINAMGMDCDGNVIDYYGGIDDIQNKKIRAVGKADDRFKEDALRMLRAIRFSTVFGYGIEAFTWGAILDNADLIGKVSCERIRKEILSATEKASHYMSSFFEALMNTTLTNHIKAFVPIASLGPDGRIPDLIYNMNRVTIRNIDYGDVELNTSNVIPFICASLGFRVSAMEALVATREEFKLLNFYGNSLSYINNTKPEEYKWSKLVEIAEGDYHMVLDVLSDIKYPAYLYEKMNIARFLSQNKPDMKALSDKVKEMGIPQGKEYGKKLAELVENAYAEKAKMLTTTISITVGNSIVNYKLVSVD